MILLRTCISCLNGEQYTGPPGLIPTTGPFILPITAYHPVKVFNDLSSFCYDHNLINSRPFQVGAFDLPYGAMSFINGIGNTLEKAIANAQRLSQYAQDAMIYGIYNATNLSGPMAKSLTGLSNKGFSIAADIVECALGRIGCYTSPVQLLKNEWESFIMTHGPDVKFLQFCHSGGATHVKNALLTSSDEVRQRIIVIAIAPSEIVPEELCFQSRNYISKRDFVTHLDIAGKAKYKDELIILEPHPDAKFFDHDFLSPTFAPILRDHIMNYIENYGAIK